jgi:hypothetical protein
VEVLVYIWLDLHTSKRPRRARVARKPDLPDRKHWNIATRDQTHIWIGIHLSGPIFLDMSCDGSSARRKAIKKTVFP